MSREKQIAQDKADRAIYEITLILKQYDAVIEIDEGRIEVTASYKENGLEAWAWNVVPTEE